MNPREFEQLLVSRRASVLDSLAASDTELSSIQSARADATGDDEHDPEGSTLATDWSRIEGLHSEAVAQLHEIDAALERIAVGTYGRCVTCGRPIPVDRLRIRPWAAQCVPCAAAQVAQRG